jgi:hypothetical protein
LDISFTGDATSDYEKLAFFIADVDTESKEGNNYGGVGNISISDATNVLSYYAQNAAQLNPQWQVIIPSLSQITGSVWEYMSNQ